MEILQRMKEFKIIRLFIIVLNQNSSTKTQWSGKVGTTSKNCGTIFLTYLSMKYSNKFHRKDNPASKTSYILWRVSKYLQWIPKHSQRLLSRSNSEESKSIFILLLVITNSKNTREAMGRGSQGQNKCSNVEKWIPHFPVENSFDNDLVTIFCSDWREWRFWA